MALTDRRRSMIIEMDAPVTEDDRMRCRCPGECVTYDGSGLTGNLFCSTGRSNSADAEM